jgi:MFS transporter, DHA2 family, multidrug resistance protein
MEQEAVLKVRHRGLLTATITLIVTMQTLDVTIASVAIPDMRGSLSATQSQVSWVLTSYVVTTAIMTPLTGFLAARIGRRRLLVGGTAGFIAASVACGAAGSLATIVLCRILQGAFGAAIAPLTQALMLDLYALRDRARVLGLFGLGVTIGPVLGPSLGGYLTEIWNWRAVFYVNVPFGFAALVGLAAYMPSDDQRYRIGFDAFGFGLFGLGIGALQLMLDRGETRDWLSSPEIVAELLMAGLCAYMCAVHLTTAKAPFLRLEMFRDRNLSAGLVVVFVFGAINLATMAVLPLFLAGVLNYPTVDIGMALAPRGLGIMVAMAASGKVVNRVDPRVLVMGGMGLVAGTLQAMTAFSVSTGGAAIFWTGLVQGIGLGLVFLTLGVATFATLEPRFRTDAAALFTLIRYVGGSMGIAVAMSVLANEIQAGHAHLAAFITPYNRALHALAPWAIWSIFTRDGLNALDAEVLQQARTIAFLNVFRLFAQVCLLCLPLALLLKPKAVAEKPVRHRSRETR